MEFWTLTTWARGREPHTRLCRTWREVLETLAGEWPTMWRQWRQEREEAGLAVGRDREADLALFADEFDAYTRGRYRWHAQEHSLEALR